MTETKLKDSGDLEIYELGYHILGTVSEENVPKEVSEIHSLISENGGTVIAEGAPTLRQLAYSITKKVDTKNVQFNKAYFGWIKFELDRVNVATIESKVDENPNILRFLIIKTVRENTLHVPKAPMFKKENHSEEKEVKAEGEGETPEVSEAEIDKSIDELIIS